MDYSVCVCQVCEKADISYRRVWGPTRGVRQMKSGILAAGKVAIVGKAIVGEMSSDSLINHEQQSQE